MHTIINTNNRCEQVVSRVAGPCNRSTRSAIGSFISLFLGLSRSWDHEITFHWGLGGGECSSLDAIIHLLRNDSSLADNPVFKQMLKGFGMTRFDKVLVMLQYKFHLSVGKSSLADEADNAFGNRNLGMW